MEQENTDGKYNGPQRVAYAARIRSVYGAEIAGGYTGFMEAADTAEGGSLSLLGGLIKPATSLACCPWSTRPRSTRRSLVRCAI